MQRQTLKTMKKITISLSAAAMLAFVGFTYGVAGLVNIEPGEVGLMVKMLGSDRGMQQETLDTGTRWVDPIRYDVPVYDTRSYQEEVQDLEAQTKDGQPVLVDISMEISLDDKGVPNLHESIGKDYYHKVVYPAFRAITRNSIGTEYSDDVYTGEARERIQERVNNLLANKLTDYGINVTINFRDLDFVNQEFVRTLEAKAIAGQKEEINRREAIAAEQEAIRVANVAEGQKQKTIKEAEAAAEQLRLQGLGERRQNEERAIGILAIATAEAEGIRLRNEAMDGPGGEKIVQMAWAENLGPNVQVWGVPTGAPGTNSIMDLNGILRDAFKPNMITP